MAGTGVLPFIRGIDLTLNNLEDDRFPEVMEDMTSLRWLKLTNTQLKAIPDEISTLQKLEHLTLKKNNVAAIEREQFKGLKSLRTLNLSRNALTAQNISSDTFDSEELNTLDLSHNELKEVPEGVGKAKSLLVLNLSHNQLEQIPSQLLMNVTDLLNLDVSYNNLEAMPPQLRRLTNLQTLVLSNNPLSHFQIRPLPAMTELQTLHMRRTQRSLSNIPGNLDALVHLADIDLSENELTKIPEGLLTLPNLKRLNLGSNQMMEVSADIEKWQHLETLILSRNQIKSLPATLCKLSKLKKLYLNENLLDFEGIPSGMGKLGNLEVFSAADNQLEMIPEGLCRCGSLKRLILARNKLITLPDAIHLTELDTLDLKGNPELIMPPKPAEMKKGAGVEFYNIDFSLQHQLRLAGASVPKSIAELQQTQKSDPVARKLRLRRRHRDNAADPDEKQAQVLKGMKAVAKDKKGGSEERVSGNQPPEESSIKAKRWDEALEKPPLDYSEFFDEDVGQFPGLSVWEIENFYPNQIEENAHGKFYEGDCYIVLQTFIDEAGGLDWKIYFWIGEKATLDKRTCSAIHSVNLRNYLGANCRTIREEQADESEEFLKLFEPSLTYIQGARTASGFYTVEEIEYTTRMYRIHESLMPNQGGSIHLEPVPLSEDSLDPRHVFLVDGGLRIYVWYGTKCKNVLKSKARLMAEKINKNERKDKAVIKIFIQGHEPPDFWQILLDLEVLEDVDEDEIEVRPPPKPHVPDSFSPVIPRLYIVGLGIRYYFLKIAFILLIETSFHPPLSGMGYLELPQVEIAGNKMKQEHLQTKNVYILDCYSDVFVWVGKKSTRLVRAAALKLSSELFAMLIRPEFAMIHRVSEGTESQVFKSKFIGWDDVIAVDFTRTAHSVQRTGADLQKWAREQDTKADLSALFAPRQQPISAEKAADMAEEWNEDLEKMEAFVLEGKKFVKLPEEERGIFHSADSYVYLCRYWVPVEDPPEDAEGHEEDEADEDVFVIVYFWQGRDAGNMGWLTFTFSLEKKFESFFGKKKLETLRLYQQKEDLKFMSHFPNGLIIKNGSRRAQKLDPNWTSSPEFYQIRSNGSPLYRRCIQIRCDGGLLNSSFCYILKVR